tara:strand:+ start:405 stop:839 length:435 start_codon:yes stop_codon:yes gene_type:complete
MTDTLFANNLDYITTSRRDRIVGLRFPLPTAPADGGFFPKSFDKEVVYQNLRQLLLTQKGERVMYPDYGTNLKAALFEPLTGSLLEELNRDIRNVIQVYEPRVFVKDLKVVQGPESDPNSIYVALNVGFTATPYEEEVIDVVIR